MSAGQGHATQDVADGIHVVQSLPAYLNEAARVAATTNAQGAALSSTDIGRVALQTDTGALWCLTSIGPNRWYQIAGPVPVRPQAGAGTYNCTVNDLGALVPMTGASANAPTIGAGLGTVGDVIAFEQQGAGLMTITASGVTFEGSSFVSAGQGSMMFAFQRAVNIWAISGKTT